MQPDDRMYVSDLSKRCNLPLSLFSYFKLFTIKEKNGKMYNVTKVLTNQLINIKTTIVTMKTYEVVNNE